MGTPLTTQNYTYNSQNQRTDLSYDLDGNMTALNGYNFTWTNRRLTSVVNEDTNISYTYNHNGIRTSKTVNGVTTNYTVDENNNIIEQTDGTNTIKFVYDSSNSPIYFTYNNATYYYEKNLQGDIVAILDANGNTVVEYTYDIWGELENITGTLADTIGAINPLRYRGYYYDTETELYYLQSRYYSPDLMRFISQDDPVLSNDQGEPLGSNLYVYCLNNPVMNSDPNGHFTIVLAGVAITLGQAIAIAVLGLFIVAYLTNPDFRNAINQLFSYLVNGMIDGANYILNVISENVATAKNARKYFGNELHHIVAQNDSRAILSQKILKRSNIGINSNYNTVLIKKTLHKHIHTSSYHVAVYLVLRSLEIKSGSSNTKKYRVISGLLYIKMLLQYANRLV